MAIQGVASDVASIQNFGRDASRCRVRARCRAEISSAAATLMTFSPAVGEQPRRRRHSVFAERGALPRERVRGALRRRCGTASRDADRASRGKTVRFANGKNDTPE
jgi:hypothetical protein